MGLPKRPTLPPLVCCTDLLAVFGGQRPTTLHLGLSKRETCRAVVRSLAKFHIPIRQTLALGTLWTHPSQNGPSHLAQTVAAQSHDHDVLVSAAMSLSHFGTGLRTSRYAKHVVETSRSANW
jgi:hypothetical protein